MLAMELDWQSPPIPIIHRSREWQPSPDGVTSSAAASTSTFLTRRRSTVLHAPPPGPPPTQPIPSVPALPPTQYATYERVSDASDLSNGTSSHMHQYTRPAASASLAAVAAFSQARLAAASSSGSSPPPSAPASPENLSDSPPRSILRPISSRQHYPSSEMIADQHLLSAPEQRPEPRPSSRRALTRALELAREAVRLDSTNDDPYGAVLAYGQSVALLSDVMERVMRGEDSTESHRRQNGRRRSVVAQEEEVRRLKSIHDTYADRMNILSLIYSIPLPPHSPPSTYASSVVSQSSTSTRPSSPSSTSPSAESSDSQHVFPPSLRRRSRDVPRHSAETARGSDAEVDPAEAIGTALTTYTALPSPNRVTTSSSAATVHPYASSSITPASSSAPSSRASLTPVPRTRPRASSTLPPPPPPPTTLPPPAPSRSNEESAPQPNALKVPDNGRLRGSSVSHSRANSASRLAALQEEKSEDLLSPTKEAVRSPRLGDDSSRPIGKSPFKGTFDLPRESPPLPPLPTPSSADSSITPRPRAPAGRTASEPAPTSQYPSARPRGGSTFSVRSEVAVQPKSLPLINTSPAMGSISQRRTKASAPPLTTGTSPTESNASDASVPSMSRLTASALSASTAASLGIGGRDRAHSQPGRRPSVGAGSYFPPGSAVPPNSAPAPRKTSTPSPLNPNMAPHISINTALLSPPLGSLAMAPLVPPPPIPHGNIPAAPLSPLPSLAPPDPLRKPYHMMTLLRQTMTSKTGGYITRRLHVPYEVWSQGGVKLSNVPEKIRVVEVLLTALEELQHWSADYFGAGNVSSGMALGIGSIGRKEGEAWATKLEEFVNVCDSVVGNFGKKLSVGEGFVTKKSSGVTSWGGRLTRQLDKITNGKNLDSPATYVQGLSRLFLQAQILDEHTKAAISSPPAPLYAAFPSDVRQALEFKLRHASEFFAKVVLTFVIQDMALLLDKYVKKCEKWLAE